METISFAGDPWVRVADAARVLGVEPDAIHRRAPRYLQTRRLGDHVCVAVSDVEDWRRSGLPNPDLERLISGELVARPVEWFTTERDGETWGYIALRKLLAHPSPDIEPGDILSAAYGEGAPLDRMASSGDVARLPLNRGVLGLVRELLDVSAALQAELREAKASA